MESSEWSDIVFGAPEQRPTFGEGDLVGYNITWADGRRDVGQGLVMNVGEDGSIDMLYDWVD